VCALRAGGAALVFRELHFCYLCIWRVAVLCEWSIDYLTNLFLALDFNAEFVSLFYFTSTYFYEVVILPVTASFRAPVFLNFIMASNNNSQATPLSRNRRESTRVKKSDRRWENVKSDVLRIYIQEGKSLKETRAAIEQSHGLKAESVENSNAYYTKG
jgi:hypothetical protein